MNTRTAWLVYSALRILFFAVPFLALYFIGWHWLLAAVVASLVAVSLSVIFLAKPREAAAGSIQAWRERDRTPDDIVEDEAADAAEESSLAETTGTAVAADDVGGARGESTRSDDVEGSETTVGTTDDSEHSDGSAGAAPAR